MAAEHGDMVDLNFEENIAIGRSSREDAKFDNVVGHLEDIIMEDNFQQMESEFLEKYYSEFENTEENKLIYTDIFNDYVNVIEKYIENSLQERIRNFSMKEFMKLLESRQDQIGGEIFDMLISFTDFLTFKEKFLDYKASKEGRVPDLTLMPTISSSTLNRGMRSVDINFHNSVCNHSSEPILIGSNAFSSILIDANTNAPVTQSPVGISGLNVGRTIQANVTANQQPSSLGNSNNLSDPVQYSTHASIGNQSTVTNYPEESLRASEDLQESSESMEL